MEVQDFVPPELGELELEYPDADPAEVERLHADLQALNGLYSEIAITGGITRSEAIRIAQISAEALPPGYRDSTAYFTPERSTHGLQAAQEGIGANLWKMLKDLIQKVVEMIKSIGTQIVNLVKQKLKEKNDLRKMYELVQKTLAANKGSFSAEIFMLKGLNHYEVLVKQTSKADLELQAKGFYGALLKGADTQMTKRGLATREFMDKVQHYLKTGNGNASQLSTGIETLQGTWAQSEVLELKPLGAESYVNYAGQRISELKEKDAEYIKPAEAQVYLKVFFGRKVKDFATTYEHSTMAIELAGEMKKELETLQRLAERKDPEAMALAAKMTGLANAFCNQVWAIQKFDLEVYKRVRRTVQRAANTCMAVNKKM